jgi:hypothetical protein
MWTRLLSLIGPTPSHIPASFRRIRRGNAVEDIGTYYKGTAASFPTRHVWRCMSPSLATWLARSVSLSPMPLCRSATQLHIPCVPMRSVAHLPVMVMRQTATVAKHQGARFHYESQPGETPTRDGREGNKPKRIKEDTQLNYPRALPRSPSSHCYSSSSQAQLANNQGVVVICAPPARRGYFF